MWSSCGQSGSRSPGAAAQMKVRLRDWLTPKLPAFSTPNRTYSGYKSSELYTWSYQHCVGLLLLVSLYAETAVK